MAISLGPIPILAWAPPRTVSAKKATALRGLGCSSIFRESQNHPNLVTVFPPVWRKSDLYHCAWRGRGGFRRKIPAGCGCLDERARRVSLLVSWNKEAREWTWPLGHRSALICDIVSRSCLWSSFVLRLRPAGEELSAGADGNDGSVSLFLCLL